MIAMVGATVGMSTTPERAASTVLPRARPSSAEPTVTRVATNDRKSRVTRTTAATRPITSPSGTGRSRQRSTTGPRMLASTPSSANGATADSRRSRWPTVRSAAFAS